MRVHEYAGDTPRISRMHECTHARTHTRPVATRHSRSITHTCTCVALSCGCVWVHLKLRDSSILNAHGIPVHCKIDPRSVGKACWSIPGLSWGLTPRHQDRCQWAWGTKRAVDCTARCWLWSNAWARCPGVLAVLVIQLVLVEAWGLGCHCVRVMGNVWWLSDSEGQVLQAMWRLTYRLGLRNWVYNVLLMSMRAVCTAAKCPTTPWLCGTLTPHLSQQIPGHHDSHQRSTIASHGWNWQGTKTLR